MKKGIIFDLDQTLVDSSRLASYRKNRQWRQVMSRLNEVKPYPEIQDIISEIRSAQRQIAIVTSSPRMYAEAVVKAHFPDLSILICYHDTVKHKPEPEPMLCGLKAMGLLAQEVIAAGDAPTDAVSAKRAGIDPVATTWGEPNAELSSFPIDTLIAPSISDFRKILKHHGIL